MRLEPTEESMYRRMDLKDHLMILIPVMGLVVSLGFFFLASPSAQIMGLGAVIAGLAGLGTCGGGFVWLKKRIMPLSGCFLEIRTDSFAAVQPYKDSKYESCRIYYKEVEMLVKERAGKGFYIKIMQTGESVIQGSQENQENPRTIFVSPFGYSREEMEKVYEVLKERVLQTAKVYEYAE
ncbi:MAG: hypothetical protein E7244_05930 [Enterocloster citroniae]|nr:hypothetical protein [Enterocloster citroniae]